MRERLAALLKPLTLAADRRGDLEPRVRARLDAVMDVLRDEYDGPGPSGEDRLAGLADVFDLDPVDVDLVTIAAAPDLDANLALAFGLLRGGLSPARASVGLALELVGLPTLSGAGPSHLGAGALARRSGLLEVSSGEPWLLRDLCMPDRVVAHLLGVDEVDPEVAPVVIAPVPIAGLDSEGLVAAAVEAGVPLVWVRSPLGAGGLSLAAGALTAAGLGCLAVDLARVPPSADLDRLVAVVVREAALGGAGLIVVHAE
ncbi:MAG TPA: hypothetical protein VMV41_14930, partial [Cellulomonadaceae bacterium]|nr:hypothetical protein [Cellulomonadaceae bacterium]